MDHYLSLILFTPLAGALLLLLVNKENENAIKWIANTVALIGFVISVPLWFWFIAWYPVAVLSEPDELISNAHAPVAVLPPPVLLFSSA